MNEDIRRDWINRYDQEKTRNQSIFSLKAFDQFVTAKYSGNENMLIEYCKKNGEETRYLMLDSMVQYWLFELEFSPSTIRNYFSFIRSYLRRFGIKTYKEDIKEYVKLPKKVRERKEPLSKDLIRKIVFDSDAKYRAFWVGLTSSGMRIEEGCLLCKKWLDFSLLEKYGLVLVHIPATETKEQELRYTFLHGQAWKLIKPFYDSQILDTEPLLGITYGAAEEYMKIIRERLELHDRYSTGVHKITIHSFRSVTRTALSDHCGNEFAWYILGQSGYLPTYYRKSYEDGAKLYKKAEAALTI